MDSGRGMRWLHIETPIPPRISLRARNITLEYPTPEEEGA